MKLKHLSAAGVLVLAVGGGAIGGIIATSGGDKPVVAQSAAPVTVHQVAEEVTPEPTVEPTVTPTAVPTVVAPVKRTTSSSSTAADTTPADTAPADTTPVDSPSPKPVAPQPKPTPVQTPTQEPKPTTCAGEAGMPKSTYADGAHVGPRYNADGTPVAKSGVNCDAGSWTWDGYQYPTKSCGQGKFEVSDDGYSNKCVDEPPNQP